jgi:hypothetical protein
LDSNWVTAWNSWGVNLLDRAGNCYVKLSGKYVARIQGKRAERRAASGKSLRAPAYRALFALLADPPLISATVRALAEAAGVSRQAAHDIRPRLQALGCAYTTSDGRFGWWTTSQVARSGLAGSRIMRPSGSSSV